MHGTISLKFRAIPLISLWAVRPVQSLSTCTSVHFTLPLPYLRYVSCKDKFVITNGKTVAKGKQRSKRKEAIVLILNQVTCPEF